MLSNLPVELIKNIQYHLSRHDMTQLATTCKYIYNITLPFLYRHLELGYQSYIKQLLKRSQLLKHIILSHTKTLTLRSRQNGNSWRIQDLICILGYSSNVTDLIFFDCCELSTFLIHQVVSILPHVKHVQFKYCHIINREENNSNTLLFREESNSNNNAVVAVVVVERVSYEWTEFTEKAILPHSSLFSHITKLDIGSNRNKYQFMNGKFVQSLPKHCPNITHLTIHLPQVHTLILCGTIIHYCSQLKYLSVQCDHQNVLFTIAQYATNLQHLILRTTYPPIQQDNGMLQIIKNCQDLYRLEIISCDLEYHVPDLIWKSCLTFEAYESLLLKKYTMQPTTITNFSAYRRPFTTESSIWFGIVSEESLTHRYRYINAIGLYKRSDKLSSFTNLILSKSSLLDLKTKLVKDFDSIMYSC